VPASISPSRNQPCEPTRVAWIEAASCLGLAWVPRQRRDPLRASSYGLGQLIARACERGAHYIVVGLGGTATVDAGIGLAQAIGVEFPGVRTPANGGALEKTEPIEIPSALGQYDAVRFLVACDVQNPLLGQRGAARAFGPQKGASARDVERLERGIAHYARLLCDATARRRGEWCLNSDERFTRAAAAPGAGAAGGIGFSLARLFGANLLSGVDLVMNSVGFEQRLARADMVITGEGKLDQSSFEGKVITGVIARASKRGIPVCVVCGEDSLPNTHGSRRSIAEISTLLEHADSVEEAKSQAEELLRKVAARLALRIAGNRR
jgi:glycerate 2-kinase